MDLAVFVLLWLAYFNFNIMFSRFICVVAYDMVFFFWHLSEVFNTNVNGSILSLMSRSGVDMW